VWAAFFCSSSWFPCVTHSLFLLPFSPLPSELIAALASKDRVQERAVAQLAHQYQGRIAELVRPETMVWQVRDCPRQHLPTALPTIPPN